MAQMVVIYRTPVNPTEFDKHYFEVHVPLAKQLPGLRKYETSRGPVVSLAGAADAYFIATLYFDSLADIKAAFDSECGRACAADRRKLAPDDSAVQIFLFDTRGV